MPSPSVAVAVRRRAISPILVIAAGIAALVPGTAVPSRAAGEIGHLVISEVVTGGASASDELIEIYNPAPVALPLEGLEVVYVSATGLTVSRRAAWGLGAPLVEPGGHVLVANELGVYAAIADAFYTSGIAATGGSVALRILDASTAVDAVGWGTAANAWTEGSASTAPPAGSSIERRPGGEQGAGQDTDDNAADFAVRDVPDPRNLGSPPVPGPNSSAAPAPSAAGTAPPSAGASLAPTPTDAPSSAPALPSPGATVVAIATARGLPDGTTVSVEATALTPSDFTDGGGFVSDASAGIAVLVTDGSFARGARLRLTGTVDERYAQRTLRVTATGIQVLGGGSDPTPAPRATGAVDDAVESTLLSIRGRIIGGPSDLAAGPAYDVDDGSGPVRVLVASGAGIDLGAWSDGAWVELVGVASQRDSSGTGAAGYRVLPRDAADVVSVAPPASAAPSPTAPPAGSPSPSASSEPDSVLAIASARGLPKNAPARVRGVVTMPPGIVDPTTAVVQDATGAIVLRLGDEAGSLARGTRVEVAGVRSTFGGLETLRVSSPPTFLGAALEPAPRTIRTADAGEALEAQLVAARGAVVAAPRRSSRGTVTFEIDDGSGPMRVTVGASLGFDSTVLAAGTWVRVTGVLGQETTGSQPTRGYRIWPRAVGDIVVTAGATGGTEAGDGSLEGGSTREDRGGSMAGGTASLAVVGGSVDPGLPIGATLVVGPWDELGFGGLLWDGDRIVALDRSAADAVRGVLAKRRPPVALEIAALTVTRIDAATGVAVAAPQPDDGGALVASGTPVARPATALPPRDGAARWVSVVGHLRAGASVLRPARSAADIRLEHACAAPLDAPAGMVGVTGLAVPDRIVVPCGGVVRAPDVARTVRGAQGAGLGTLVTHEENGSTAADRTPAGPPSVVAVLLGMGAFGLLAGGIVARRLSSDDPEPDDASDRAGAEQTDDAAEDPLATHGSGPSLRLIRLPRERAP